MCLVAVLLEGSFNSLYANRLTPHYRILFRVIGEPFAKSSAKPGKQIVMSDGDIVTTVSNTTGPLLPMGQVPLKITVCQPRVFLNCVDYPLAIMVCSRQENKDFTLRLLNKEKVEAQRSMWQFINIVVPVMLIIIMFGLIYQWRRKQQYTA